MRRRRKKQDKSALAGFLSQVAAYWRHCKFTYTLGWSGPGFGLYFTGAASQTLHIKRSVQIIFIAGAIFYEFAFFVQGNAVVMNFAGRVTALVLAIYCALDYWLSRRKTNN